MVRFSPAETHAISNHRTFSESNKIWIGAVRVFVKNGLRTKESAVCKGGSGGTIEGQGVVEFKTGSSV